MKATESTSNDKIEKSSSSSSESSDGDYGDEEPDCHTFDYSNVNLESEN